MSLNLISDPWIPVRCSDGARRVIAPWQITEPGVEAPDWPRPDLNIACYELLIGLVYMADPPANITDWDRRAAPDPARLRERLAPFAPAFNLLGDGPLFLQDQELLQGEPERSVQLLFLDSGGEDGNLFAKTDRYDRLSLPEAAMALYLLQSQAPEGGRGYRTSLRGGGPLVTLVNPHGSLWDLVWANVPYGTAFNHKILPWMSKPTDRSLSIGPEGDRPFDALVFFGMPRRIRLVPDTSRSFIDRVVQKSHGQQYSGWKHPCTPYSRKSPAEPWHPVRGVRAVGFGYRNWLGVIAEAEDTATSERALTIRNWRDRGGDAGIIVSGWAMKSAKARDFTLSVEPFLDLEPEAEERLIGLIQAAEAAGVALRGALEPVLAAGEAREAEREAFFLATEARFATHLVSLRAGADPRADWLVDLRAQALRQFDALAVPGIDQRETDQIRRIVEARKFLSLALAGHGKQGRAIFEPLGLELPQKKGKAA